MKPHSQPAPPARSGRIAVIGLVFVVGIAAVALWPNGDKGDDEPADETTTLEERYIADRRVGFLTEPCAFVRTFDADTSDIARILTSKLDAGAQREPLRRATQDLAQLGALAEDDLTRLFHDSLADPLRSGVTKNVLAVCALSTDDFGLELARIALGSPRDELRREAAIVMGQHPSPDNFTPLIEALPGLELPSILEHAIKALWLADSSRFVTEMQRWLVEAAPGPGATYQSPLVLAAVKAAAAADTPALAERLRGYADRFDGLTPMMRAMLLAPAARLGDEALRQEFRDLSVSDYADDRRAAAEALAQAQIGHELVVLATLTKDPFERASAWKVIFEQSSAASEAEMADVREVALETLGDDESAVREAGLKGLIAAGHPRAQAELLALLGGRAMERSQAAGIIRGRIADQPDFRDAVRELLAVQWRNELEGSRVVEELKSIIVALGATPGAETGRMILRFADEYSAAVDPASRSNQLTYRDFVGQVFNAGPASRDVLLEQLGRETDPMRRIDLINLAWQDREEDSFEVLAGIVQDETRHDLERLYTADRLTQMGMPRRVAPLLKRVYRSVTEGHLHRGLQCILWAWYGPPMGGL